MHRYSKLSIVDIARICYEANRAYCQVIADANFPILPPWEDASPETQLSIMTGATVVIESPTITAPELHEKWCADKMADGWKYGPVKDAKAKEHPCLVDYWALPQEQRRKDDLFRAIVFALK